jgi:hypothetical protein
VSPSNATMLHVATRLGFISSGTLLSDRWGALVRFTKFLDTPSESVFTRQFCSQLSGTTRGRIRTKGERHEEAFCTELPLGPEKHVLAASIRREASSLPPPHQVPHGKRWGLRGSTP